MPPMQVQRIDDFLALVPMPSHAANAAINAAAAACVTQLQPLAARLFMMSWPSAAQQRSSAFHMPLTGPLSLGSMTTHRLLVLDVRSSSPFLSDLPTLQFNQLPLFAEPAPGGRLRAARPPGAGFVSTRLAQGFRLLTARGDDAALNAAGQSAMVGSGPGAPVVHFCPGLPIRTSSTTMSDITIYHNPVRHLAQHPGHDPQQRRGAPGHRIPKTPRSRHAAGADRRHRPTRHRRQCAPRKPCSPNCGWTRRA